MRCFLLLMLALGMFDLPPGRWEGELLCVTVGPPETREMVWETEGGVARGTYEVTATKGQPHVTFTILEAPEGLELEGVALTKGGEVRLILDYAGEAEMQLDVFHPDLSHAFRMQLREAPGRDGDRAPHFSSN